MCVTQTYIPATAFLMGGSLVQLETFFDTVSLEGADKSPPRHLHPP